MDDQVLQLGPEGLRLLVVDEVAVLDAPGGDGVDHPVGDLAQRPLALVGARGAPEVLLGQDVGGVQAPALGDLDIQLLEGDRPVPIVGDPRVTSLPDDLVIGMDLGRGEVAADADTGALWGDGHSKDLFSGCFRLSLESGVASGVVLGWMSALSVFEGGAVPRAPHFGPPPLIGAAGVPYRSGRDRPAGTPPKCGPQPPKHNMLWLTLPRGTR